jgi:hypothetical protein
MENQTNQTKKIEKENDYTKFDEKTIATIKASAIWNTVATIIMSVAGMLASYFFIRNLYNNIAGQYSQYLGSYMNQITQPQMINITVLISDIIYGAIGGAIAGWVIAKFYPVFVGWQKKYLGNKLNSFFKILFWPYLVGFAISLVITGALSIMYAGFTAFIIIIIADLVGMYLYAKMMDKAVGKYYK